jgi:release factor glutamine methyltransferase
MDVRSWIAEATGRLSGIPSPNLEAQMLAAHSLGVDRSWIFAHPDAEFPELAGESLLVRRLAHEPLAYVLGWREFFGRRFSIDRRALIPRQETEVLVETALARARSGDRVLDLGTGSGCIGISLKLERPDLVVTASDVSSDALDLAKMNASDLSAELEFVQSDLFSAIEARFDLIVSNPPYIGRGERLDSEVADFEPHDALFGGATGDELILRLADQAREHLENRGLLLLEVGYRQARRIAEAIDYEIVEIVPDLSGIERVLVAKA